MAAPEMTIARFLSALLPIIAVATAAQAHDYAIKALRIVHPYATPTVPAQTNGAVYFTLENKGKESLRLIRASTPLATRVEVHRMTMDGNVARMREVGTIPVNGGETVTMAPSGGYHLMLVGLKSPLKDGDKFPLIVEFEGAGKIELSVFVQKPKSATDAAVEHHHP